MTNSPARADFTAEDYFTMTDWQKITIEKSHKKYVDKILRKMGR